jgi:hypothetical protein
MKMHEDKDVLKMRKLALVEDTIREAKLFLRMRNSAHRLTQKRRIVALLEAKVLRRKGDINNDVVQSTEHLEKAVETAKAQILLIEAERKVLLEEFIHFPSLMRLLFRKDPNNPGVGTYNRTRDMASTEHGYASGGEILLMNKVVLLMIERATTMDVSY